MAGADKEIRFSPPGAIGLVDPAAKLIVRFDELETATRPQDDARVCGDFDVTLTAVATAMPTLVPASLGRGRVFNGGTTGLGARDLTPGSTLLTRDASVQVVMSWDAAAQDAAGFPGTIVSRGVGGSAAEYVSYGLRIDVVDPATFTGLVRWYWHDVAGVEHLQTGAQIVFPPGQYTMITATRRWVSPTQVELAYYVGDQLAAGVTSTDGSIGGGTTGLLQLGCRTVAGVNGAFLAGTMDELLVADREMCAEEIEDTWLRITRYQPLGVGLFKDSIDQGFPLSEEPASDAQLDIRMIGQALGYAGANIERMRANFLPQRAYGSVLEDWEAVTAVTPQPGVSRSIAERRARVLARFRQRRGVSIPGLQDALASLVDCDVDDLEFRAFDNTVTEDFAAAPDPHFWTMRPAACMTSSSGHGRFAPGAGTFIKSSDYSNWLTIDRAVSQPWRSDLAGLEHVFAKLVLTTPQAGVEAGVWFGDRAARNFLLLGLRDDAGTFKVVYERFVDHVSQGPPTVITALGGNPAAIWLHLYEVTAGQWSASYSITSASSGFVTTAPFSHPSLALWSGLYFRSTGAIGAAVADFDDFKLWTPNGTRPFNAYVFRDPGLGGIPDMAAGRSVIRSIRHAFTYGTITESMDFILGDDGSLLGIDPL